MMLKEQKISTINGKIDGFIGANKVYIGRAGRNIPGSVLANPYIIGRDGDRAQVIALYREWLWQNMLSVIKGELGATNQLWEELVKLAIIVAEGGSVQLICYCKPKACHGDVIVAAVEWIVKNKWHIPL